MALTFGWYRHCTAFCFLLPLCSSFTDSMIGGPRQTNPGNWQPFARGKIACGWCRTLVIRMRQLSHHRSFAAAS